MFALTHFVKGALFKNLMLAEYENNIEQRIILAMHL